MKIGLDKQLHFLGCFAIAAAVYTAIPVLWLVVVVPIVVGVTKEVVDSRNPRNYFSWMDIVANVAGAASFGLWAYLCSLLGV